MALKDITIPTSEVSVGTGGSFAVRGLSTSDIQHLVRNHGTILKKLFSEYMSGELNSLEQLELGPVLREILTRAPEMVCDVINVAADGDKEDAKIISRLPSAVQVQALGAIFSLTLTTEGDLGNALDSAVGLIGALNEALGDRLKTKI